MDHHGRKFTTPINLTVSAWIANFSLRIDQLGEMISTAKSGGALSLRSFDYWLGGLFNPDAFITATRQCIAQANSWSLEDLSINLIVDSSAAIDDAETSFALKNLSLHGAKIEKGNKVNLGRSVVTELKTVKLQWKGPKERSSNEQSKKSSITLPIYLNSDRSEILINVDFDMAPNNEERFFIETGVAFLANP